jgi:hypothetical protein
MNFWDKNKKKILPVLAVSVTLFILVTMYFVLQWFILQQKIKNTALLFLSLLPDSDQANFDTQCRSICDSLGINPHVLMFIMYSESSLNPQAQNPSSTATGILQWTEATAEGLGTSTADLLNMTALQQLPFVQKYFAQVNYNFKNWYDVYLSVFLPSVLGNPDSFVLPSYCNLQLGFDPNASVTIAQFKTWAFNKVQAKVPSSYLSFFPQ